ncbi:MAG: dihydroorotase [Chloroherpetonaceae bacterium]|nr:dihydroorotase [Chloroherpetonaceae bacterium]
MTYLFQNARLVNPAENLDKIGSMRLSESGVIDAIAFAPETLSPIPSDKVLDFSGKIIASGLFDMHCHFREPGFEYKEDLQTGSRSAIAGGFTGVAVMPNTEPPIDNAQVATYLYHKAQSLPIEIEVIGAITQGRKGEKICNYGELWETGVKAISDDGSPVMNSRAMRLAFEYATMFDLLVIQHCEDIHLSAGGAMNEGVYSSLMGLRGIPSVAETIVLSRDLNLMRYLLDAKKGALPNPPRYHVAHISAKEAVKLAREAKAEGLRVSCEVTPHHFALTDKDVFESGFDGDFRMNPPLRSERDRDAILQAIADGAIDAIATDHAPHACHEKNCGIAQASFGIVGLETSVGLTFGQLVHKNIISAYRAIELLSTNPRRLMNLPPIRFEIGREANLSFIDPDAEWVVDTSQLQSKSKNSPFKNFRLKGKAIGVACKGKVWLND